MNPGKNRLFSTFVPELEQDGLPGYHSEVHSIVHAFDPDTLPDSLELDARKFFRCTEEMLFRMGAPLDIAGKNDPRTG